MVQQCCVAGMVRDLDLLDLDLVLDGRLLFLMLWDVLLVLVCFIPVIVGISASQ